MAVESPRSRDTHNVNPLRGDAASEAARSLAQAPETLLAAAAEGQREFLSFMAMRLEKDRNAIREVTSCQNWADVVHLQFDWMQEMLRDYGEQTSRMLALATASGGATDRSPAR